ncbi:MAG TPA: DUF5677 domain-containing protein [Terriglobales bacterium]|nr:DUF5677 domain-containing protein [Terriglobales bacterium]
MNPSEMRDEELAGAVIGSVGFPDFWPTAYGKCSDQLAAIARAISLQNRLCAIPIRADPVLPLVIRWMLQVAANTTGAIMVLAINGFGPDAMRLARGTFEFDVNALYLAKHPSEIEDFVEYRHINWKKTIEHLDKGGSAEAKRFSAEMRAKNEAEYARVVGRFTRKGRIRNSWARASLFKRAVDVGLGALYPTFYGMTSQLHHGDVSGLTQQVDPETANVISAPDMAQVEVVLNCAHRALASLISTYNRIVPLGQGALVEEMDAEFERVWAKRAVTQTT